MNTGGLIAMGRLVMSAGRGIQWRRLAVLKPGDPEGSLSHNWPDGSRDVLLFRRRGDHSLIWLSKAGADYTTADRAHRTILTAGRTVAARLAAGESFEMDVVTDSGAAMRVRWAHEEGA